MEQPDVLVLEPDTDTRASMRDVLRAMDVALVVFGSLPEALTRAESAPLAAVIANVHTLIGTVANSATLESGLRAAIEGLRATQRAWPAPAGGVRPFPIIVTSSAESLTEHAAALDAGADLYLSEEEAMNTTIMGRYLERLLRHRPLDPASEPEAVERPAALHVTDIFALPTEDLRSASGRLDAGRIADALDVPLVKLAEAVAVSYTTVHKTPDSLALQPRLHPFASVLAMLHQIYAGDARRVLAWLQSAQPALGGRTPQAALLAPGGAAGVEQFVAGAWLGEGE